MKKHTKSTLTREEGLRFERYVSENLINFDNKSSKDIAKECNEELGFVNEDGSPKLVNNQHVDRLWQMLNRCGYPVWEKNNYKDRSNSKLENKFNMLEILVDKLSTRMSSFHKRLMYLEEKENLQVTRDCTEEVAFSTNKSRGEAMNKLFDDRRDN